MQRQQGATVEESSHQSEAAEQQIPATRATIPWPEIGRQALPTLATIISSVGKLLTS